MPTQPCGFSSLFFFLSGGLKKGVVGQASGAGDVPRNLDPRNLEVWIDGVKFTLPPAVYQTPNFFEAKDLTVKLSFKNEGKQAGVSFVGRFPAEGRERWNDRIGLNLFAEYDYLKIYLETGDSKDQIELMSQKVPAESNGFHSIYLIFKDSGKTVKILSPQGTTIKELDLPKIYPPTLSQGLFPDKKFYLGLSLAPGSKLTISEFFGFTF